MVWQVVVRNDVQGVIEIAVYSGDEKIAAATLRKEASEDTIIWQGEFRSVTNEQIPLVFGRMRR
jgi:hypothetical protein